MEALRRAGFSDDQIGFVMQKQEGESGEIKHDTDDGGAGGVIGGILAGAGVGGVVAAAAALLIPGFGPVVAGGILATVLGGAAIGAAAGGLIGALTQMGVPEEEARYYEGEVREGRILVTVKAEGRYQEARDILKSHDAYDIESRDTMGTAMSHTDTRPRPTAGRTESESVELREEHLTPRTERVETGEVNIGKEVVTERQQIDVPVTHEEVVVERRPVDGRTSSTPIGHNEEIRVPVHEERVDVDRETVVHEEINVGTRPVQHTERVTEEVRREEPVIERHGDVNVQGSGGAAITDWNETSPRYRERWQSRWGTSGGRWEDYEPGYRYSYEMSRDPRFQNRSWDEVEPDLRRDYGTWSQRYGYRHSDNDWDRMREQMRESWENESQTRRAA